MKNNTQATDEEKNIKKLTVNREIIVGISEFDTLNPITTKSIEMQYISKLIYKPLIEITQDFNTREGIAKEWSKTGENEYIIKLNDVKWHNGSMVTSRDVEFTINTIKNTESIYKENVEKIQNVDIIDEKILKLKLIEDTDFFEYLLCFPIVKENTYNNDNIGTGDYKVEEVKEKQIVLKNQESKIIINIYDSVAEMYSEFSKEKVDLLITQNSEYSEYIKNIGVTEQIITGRNFYYITFNNQKLEKEIKNQIKNLINREQIIYELYKNKYVIADFPLEYGSYLNRPIKNEEKNKAFQQELNLGVGQDEELYKIAELIKKELEEKGIKVNIVYYSNFEEAIENNYYDLVLNRKMVEIVPKIDYYFQDEELKQYIINSYKVENKDVLKERYNKIIEQYEIELPFMGLFFNSYIIIHHSKVKGNFDGNWYNVFYNIDTWYKVE